MSVLLWSRLLKPLRGQQVEESRRDLNNAPHTAISHEVVEPPGGDEDHPWDWKAELQEPIMAEDGCPFVEEYTGVACQLGTRDHDRRHAYEDESIRIHWTA